MYNDNIRTNINTTVKWVFVVMNHSIKARYTVAVLHVHSMRLRRYVDSEKFAETDGRVQCAHLLDFTWTSYLS